LIEKSAEVNSASVEVASASKHCLTNLELREYIPENFGPVFVRCCVKQLTDRFAYSH